jgi:acyl transferase domain-containing protein/NAD(P)-dependent dehydrogenase (short-subunit alcohol dehydrogenase family)
MLDFRIIGISPFYHPDPHLVAALAKTDALGVLDLGVDPLSASDALDALTARNPRRFGVLIRPGMTAPDLAADAIVILSGSDYAVEPWAPRTVLAQVTNLEEARRAEAAGVAGLIAKGTESGGRVGEKTSFILLQHLVRETDLPIWVQGGIGPHTAAACVAGGARGVVIDAQLALARESRLPAPVKDAIASMDGSETTLVDNHRVFSRPDLSAMLARTEGDVAQRLGATDLSRKLLPAGQDAALAAWLAERCVTAGGIVRTLLDSIRDSLEAAKATDPLAPGAPLAELHQLHYPVFQGPMTRVSDTAEFANAVSAAGGMPFVALSMLRAKASQKLLRETKKLVGDRPWGVGVLGFVDAELRAEQLAAIEAIRPPVALIAGGRPSQARPLEDKGIATYLHVPSPGLLKLFLSDGARRFIFEGRECGGHVGPRTSFVLWELQLRELMAFNRPEELCLVFAGGIHDARSAAMVAAMAAPLAARGAKIGVLMGTAYLFTKEAVDHAAILPAYQEAAVGCAHTVLLETAPGHATRCIDSPYVRAFIAERERLETEGKDSKEIWAELEKLNLGRLRIASKGMRREGRKIVDVDHDEQLKEGMYMIGDIATLHHKVSTAEELHREVTQGATEYLKQIHVEPAPMEKPAPADIAVVGMSCIFPGASDVDRFWSNIVDGVRSISEVDPERWNPAFYYDPKSRNGDTTSSKWGGFIDDVLFNPLDYGIPPQSLTTVDPSQLLALETAKRALEDAGYGTREFDRSRVSVIFGAESGADISAAYGFRSLYPQLAGPLPPELDAHLPRLTEDSFPGVLANVIAGRIANRLDLRGSNFTVDAACASSLAALDMAVKELAAGTSDMVLCGGVDLHNGINDYLLFSGVHALSPSGLCKTFDSDADGIALGEGVACVVLKRLADAERDGDRIYSVVKSVAGSSDGRSLGLTAPRKEGQILAVERAYARAGVSPVDVGLVEAHGTGTVVGDRTELGTLTDSFVAAGAGPGRCGLGSVKSQIGHTKCAAGLASVIKVSKALYHRVLPPTLNIKQPNPAYDPKTSPFALSDTARPWLEARRSAGVSAFGFGGSNFHTVLTTYDDAEEPEAGFTDWPFELFLLRGKDLSAAKTRARSLLTCLEVNAPLRLRDLAASVTLEGEGVVQLAVIAATREELRAALQAALAGKADGKDVFFAEAVDGKIAFLYPGQGSQRPNMLRELFLAFPQLRRLLDMGLPWLDALFPPTAWTEEQRTEQKAAITDTRVAQPTLGITGLAMADLLERAGVQPAMAAGHSYGELVALCRAGVFGEADLLELSLERAEAILEAAEDTESGMAAVAADAPTVEAVLEGIPGVVAANHNAPDQTVISAPRKALDQALKQLDQAGISARPIAVAAAFHSPVVAAASDRLRGHLQHMSITAPTMPVWSNTTAEPYPETADAIRNRLAEHVAKPVLFNQQIEAMYAAGARIFVEAGPGRVLSGLVKRILGKRDYRIVTCNTGRGSGIRDFLAALARLATLGVAMDPSFLFVGRNARRLDLSEPARLQVPPTTWKINGWLVRPYHGEPPKNRLRPTPHPIISGAAAPTPAAPAPAAPREETVVEYLRNLRELAIAQRDVMLGFLGAEPSPNIRSVEPATPRPSARPALPKAPELPALARSAAQTVPPAQPTEIDVEQALLGIVSEKTGYPQEMLGLDLDLEAELSIDSIKRVEILGALAGQIGLDESAGADRDYIIEQLAAKKSLREIIDWLKAQAPEQPAEVSTPAATAPPPAAAPPSRVDVQRALLAIVSEKTGYPQEMLGLDLDLEAELSIDSIKRVEILGALAGQIGLDESAGTDRDYIIEQLAAKKSLREIVDWLEDRTADQGKEAAPAASVEPDIAMPEVRRYLPEITDIPAAKTDPNLLAGKRFALSDADSPVAKALATQLKRQDATVELLPYGSSPGEVDGLIYLGALRDPNGIYPAKELFDLARQAIRNGARWVCGLTALGGQFGRSGESPFPAASGGLAGLLKSLAKEKPELRVGVIDIDLSDQPTQIATQVVEELSAEQPLAEVGYRDGKRYTVHTVLAEIDASTGGALALDKESLVLVTGGARGITAGAVIELARRTGCKLVLVGRSPLPEPERPEYAGAEDLATLRKRVIELGKLKTPKEIEAECRRVMGAREVRATLDAVRATGSELEYHSLDVRDAQGFGELIDDLYKRHGRIDGVIHGAGIIEDKLMLEKPRESFDRVFDTKVAAARTLESKLKDNVRFVVFFSSVSGAFGNRGQTDYAAAGDLLDKLALDLQKRISGRVVSIDWGPWGGTGMVSDELAREYARQGVGLIPVDEGIRRLFQELEWGPATDAQVILMAAEPSVMP